MVDGIERELTYRMINPEGFDRVQELKLHATYRESHTSLIFVATPEGEVHRIRREVEIDGQGNELGQPVFIETHKYPVDAELHGEDSVQEISEILNITDTEFLQLQETAPITLRKHRHTFPYNLDGISLDLQIDEHIDLYSDLVPDKVRTSIDIEFNDEAIKREFKVSPPEELKWLLEQELRATKGKMYSFLVEVGLMAP